VRVPYGVLKESDLVEKASGGRVAAGAVVGLALVTGVVWFGRRATRDLD
jgi:hypothetical protein